jgi:hypothetical protein
MLLLLFKKRASMGIMRGRKGAKHCRASWFMEI